MTSGSVNTGVRQIKTKWGVKMGFLGAETTDEKRDVIFRYQFPEDLNDEILDSEYDLHKYTSHYTSSPSNVIGSNKSNVTMTKCLYALGDVDRDGNLGDDDLNLIMKGIVGLMVESNRSTSTYDRLAFELAADCNEDGVIDILDTIRFNKLISATGT